MKKNASIELSVNFLVIAIISIIMLGLSIVLVRNLTSQGSYATDKMDSQMRKQIELLLDKGDKVTIPMTTKEISRGKNGVFGLGILNVLGQDTTFKVDIICKAFVAKVNPQDPPLLCGLNDPKVTFIPTQLIENNKKGVYKILVEPKTAASGTYAYGVTVKYGTLSQNYADPEYRIYVTVP